MFWNCTMAPDWHKHTKRLCVCQAKAPNEWRLSRRALYENATNASPKTKKKMRRCWMISGWRLERVWLMKSQPRPYLRVVRAASISTSRTPTGGIVLGRQLAPLEKQPDGPSDPSQQGTCDFTTDLAHKVPCWRHPPRDAPANTAIRSTSSRGLVINRSSAPTLTPAMPPTGTATDGAPVSQARSSKVLHQLDAGRSAQQHPKGHHQWRQRRWDGRG